MWLLRPQFREPICSGSTPGFTAHHPSHECDPCDRSFESQHALDQHLNSPAQHPSYECDPCDRSFGSQYGLDQHLNSHVHHPSYECDQCDHNFWTAQALDDHRENAAGHRRIKCIAVGCSRVFGSRSAMMRHWEGGKCCAGINSLVDRFAQTHLVVVGEGRDRESDRGRGRGGGRGRAQGRARGGEAGRGRGSGIEWIAGGPANPGSSPANSAMPTTLTLNIFTNAEPSRSQGRRRRR